MDFSLWYLLVGVLLILVVLANTWIERLPLSPAMIYLGLGWLFGYLGWIGIDPLKHAKWLEHASEVGVIVSLFSAGLKLRSPLNSPEWRLPVLLAFGSMVITIGLLTTIGVLALKLPVGVALILAAVLAPTDPVLASEIQVTKPGDRNSLRFTLTAEAGLNDGAAFPFVMLGLGLMHLHPIGDAGFSWVWRDVIWAIFGGLVIGAVLGSLVARLILYLRRSRHEAVGAEDFIALGLIAASYGGALVVHAYGFLAVFAAGLALRRVERELSGEDAPLDVKASTQPAEELATHPRQAPGYLAAAVLDFNEQLERIAELALVLTAGALLAVVGFSSTGLVLAGALILVVRPLSTLPVSIFFKRSHHEGALIAWFGIRGIGSIYYLFYAIGQGLPEESARQIVNIVLPVIAVSICIHGVTAGPLLKHYMSRTKSG